MTVEESEAPGPGTVLRRGSSHNFNRLVRRHRHPAALRADLVLHFYNRYHPRAQRLHAESRDEATQGHQDATRWYRELDIRGR